MNASLSTLFEPINKFFGKYHSTIFFTFITLLLAAAILVLYLATLAPVTAATSDPTQVISSTFDDKTADKVQRLRQSDESTSGLTFPTPRGNPFVE